MNKLERLVLWMVAVIVFTGAVKAAYIVTSTGHSSGTVWFRLNGVLPADRAMCTNGLGSIGTCTLSLTTGNCLTGCVIP